MRPWRIILGLVAWCLVVTACQAQPADPLLARRVELSQAAPASYHVRFVYAIPSDGTDRRLDVNGVTDGHIRRMQDWLAPRANGRRLRVVEREGRPQVFFVRLGLSEKELNAAADASTLFNTLLEAMHTAMSGHRGDERLIVLYDGASTIAACSSMNRWPPQPPYTHAFQMLRGSDGDCSVGPVYSFDGGAGFSLTLLRQVLLQLGGASECASHFGGRGYVSDSPRDILYLRRELELPTELDVGRDDYFGHGRRDCLDIANSPFLTPHSGPVARDADQALARRIHVGAAEPAPYHVRFVYAVPSGGHDRRLDLSGAIGHLVKQTQSWFAKNADGKRFRVASRDGEPEILFVQLDHETTLLVRSGDPSTRFSHHAAMHRFLRAAGGNRPLEIFIVFYDDPSIPSERPCGNANFRARGSGGVIAVLWMHGNRAKPWCNIDGDGIGNIPPIRPLQYHSVAHEILHVLGAVPDCGRGSPDGHIVDDPDDVMFHRIDGGAELLYVDRQRSRYFGHGRPECLDIARSPFLTSDASESNRDVPNLTHTGRTMPGGAQATPNGIRFVYAIPSDGDDRSLDTNGVLVESIMRLQSWLAVRADGRRLRVASRDGLPEIIFARLPASTSSLNQASRAGRLVTELRTMLRQVGALKSNELPVVIYDGDVAEASCTGTDVTAQGADERLIVRFPRAGDWMPDCDPQSGLVYEGASDFSLWVLEDLVRALGVTPRCAPHWREGGYVSDDPRDLLYRGPNPKFPDTFDANRDDYFGHGRRGCADLADSPFLTRPQPAPARP